MNHGVLLVHIGDVQGAIAVDAVETVHGGTGHGEHAWLVAGGGVIVIAATASDQQNGRCSEGQAGFEGGRSSQWGHLAAGVGWQWGHRKNATAPPTSDNGSTSRGTAPARAGGTAALRPAPALNACFSVPAPAPAPCPCACPGAPGPGRAGGRDATAVLAAFGAQVDDPVGLGDHVRSCSMTTTLCPPSTRRCSTRMSFCTSAMCGPTVGSSSTYRVCAGLLAAAAHLVAHLGQFGHQLDALGHRRR